MKQAILLSVGAIVIATMACKDSLVSSTPGPQVRTLVVEKNQFNELSLVAHVSSVGADSARAIVRTSASTLDTTPFVEISEPSATTIPILGLAPSSTYKLVVEVKRGALTVRTDSVSGTTGQLPSPLQDLRLQFTGAIPSGYILTAPFNFKGDTVGYVVAFDTLGQIRWYREFREGIGGMPVIETKQQVNGNFTAYVGPTGRPPLLTRYYEFTPGGDVVREYTAPAPLYLDNHELQLTFDAAGVPTAHYFAYDFRHVDSFPPAQKGDTMIAGHRLVRQRYGAEPEIVWSSWEHFSVADVTQPGSSFSIDHPNSLAFDVDSNYIVSWRNLGEITKIHARTGAVMWRLGGLHNEFAFVNDPLNGFSGQHSARVLSNGNLLLFDNGWTHGPSETRAVEYHLDVAQRTATLVWEYRHAPAIFAPYVGSVQRQSNGNTLIGYGFVSHITEVRADKTVVFDASLNSTNGSVQFYRALRVPSLYRYSQP